MDPTTPTTDPVAAFLEAAVVPREGDHRSGTLAAARAVLAAHPDLPARDIFVAAALGDENAVRAHLARDAASAAAKGGPRGWDALTYLCFSNFLRLDAARAAGFVRAAAAHGIDPARVIFAPRTERFEDHLARMRLAGLFLDTLPYNAHTTASDALWAGVPVVTWRGKALAGRVAASLLGAIGLPDLVTTTLADYEALALRLATRRSHHQSVHR